MIACVYGSLSESRGNRQMLFFTLTTHTEGQRRGCMLFICLLTRHWRTGWLPGMALSTHVPPFYRNALHMALARWSFTMSGSHNKQWIPKATNKDIIRGHFIEYYFFNEATVLGGTTGTLVAQSRRTQLFCFYFFNHTIHNNKYYPSKYASLRMMTNALNSSLIKSQVHGRR